MDINIVFLWVVGFLVGWVIVDLIRALLELHKIAKGKQ